MVVPGAYQGGRHARGGAGGQAPGHRQPLAVRPPAQQPLVRLVAAQLARRVRQHPQHLRGWTRLTLAQAQPDSSLASLAAPQCLPHRLPAHMAGKPPPGPPPTEEAHNVPSADSCQPPHLGHIAAPIARQPLLPADRQERFNQAPALGGRLHAAGRQPAGRLSCRHTFYSFR